MQVLAAFSELVVAACQTVDAMLAVISLPGSRKQQQQSMTAAADEPAAAAEQQHDQQQRLHIGTLASALSLLTAHLAVDTLMFERAAEALPKTAETSEAAAAAFLSTFRRAGETVTRVVVWTLQRGEQQAAALASTAFVVALSAAAVACMQLGHKEASAARIVTRDHMIVPDPHLEYDVWRRAAQRLAQLEACFSANGAAVVVIRPAGRTVLCGVLLQLCGDGSSPAAAAPFRAACEALAASLAAEPSAAARAAVVGLGADISWQEIAGCARDAPSPLPAMFQKHLRLVEAARRRSRPEAQPARTRAAADAAMEALLVSS